MKLKEFINEDEVYTRVEKEITEWVEATYNGLSVDFSPTRVEIVRTNPIIDYKGDDVVKITEVVNLKIDEILYAHAEEIYIAERLTRIWKNHPRFNIEVESLEDIKKNPKFVKYLSELIIKPKNVVNIQDYRREEVDNG